VITCSAALGSRFRIAWAALLFLVVIAAAKGVKPALSLMVRSRPGCANRREIITACWFSMAIWIGAFPSASYRIAQIKVNKTYTTKLTLVYNIASLGVSHRPLELL
jgi:hypothetical protein